GRLVVFAALHRSLLAVPRHPGVDISQERGWTIRLRPGWTFSALFHSVEVAPGSTPIPMSAFHSCIVEADIPGSASTVSAPNGSHLTPSRTDRAKDHPSLWPAVPGTSLPGSRGADPRHGQSGQ